MLYKFTVRLKNTFLKVADALQNYHSNVLYIRAREERMRRSPWGAPWLVGGCCSFVGIFAILAVKTLDPQGFA